MAGTCLLELIELLVYYIGTVCSRNYIILLFYPSFPNECRIIDYYVVAVKMFGYVMISQV